MTTKTVETHHGIPVLAIHVGDALPSPTYPVRYAVHIGPDLARYLLTFNHEHNRSRRPRKIRALASDMTAGRWMLSPAGLVFDSTGVLNDGQNRLLAVIESGTAVWMVVDFGWPVGVLRAIDRGTGRTTADMLHLTGAENAGLSAAAHARVWQYRQLVGTSRGVAGFDVPTSMETEEAILREPERWHNAIRRGDTIYRGLDKGCAASLWAAFFYLAEGIDADAAERFFLELRDGTGDPGSATRKIADWFRRRPVGKTYTGDPREPLELMIRAWNSWISGRSMPFLRQSGFEWSRLRGAS